MIFFKVIPIFTVPVKNIKQCMGYELFIKFFDFKTLNPFMPGSGSVSKFGLDPDPYQNDPDPQHKT